jgi:hypothetical protein
MEIHPQRAVIAAGPAHSRANPHSVEQVIDFKREIPAHFVIVLSQ